MKCLLVYIWLLYSLSFQALSRYHWGFPSKTELSKVGGLVETDESQQAFCLVIVTLFKSLGKERLSICQRLLGCQYQSGRDGWEKQRFFMKVHRRWPRLRESMEFSDLLAVSFPDSRFLSWMVEVSMASWLPAARGCPAQNLQFCVWMPSGNHCKWRKGPLVRFRTVTKHYLRKVAVSI